MIRRKLHGAVIGGFLLGVLLVCARQVSPGRISEVDNAPLVGAPVMTATVAPSPTLGVVSR